MDGKLLDNPRNLSLLAQAATILESRCDEIVAYYEELLRGIGSPLLGYAESGEQLKTQAKSAVLGAAESLRGVDPSPPLKEGRLSESIGTSRARLGVHPSESLRAAGKLSEAALLVLLKELPDAASYREVGQISVSIQQSILERVMRASVSYGEYLLRAVHESNTDERRRISRELHDRVGSLMTIVHQNLELYKALKSSNLSRAEGKLELAQQAAWDALRATKELSLDLRRSVVEEGLEGALSDLLSAIVPPEVRASVSIRGDEALLQPHVRDELFLIMREAIRNTLNHSRANTIRVELSTSPNLVYAAVKDDGCGIDAARAGSAAGTGLKSMEERVYFLGGTLCISSELGGGTAVEVRIPLVRRQQ